MVVIEKEHTFIEIDAWCIGECENTVYEICFEIVKKKREKVTSETNLARCWLLKLDRHMRVHNTLNYLILSMTYFLYVKISHSKFKNIINISLKAWF